MKSNDNIAAIYDFELFPYALGDVLTWNVRTAMRCEELGRELVDIYICVDERYPAGIYQRGLVNSQNFELFFSELYGAFGTHPKLGNIHIFRQREALLVKLEQLVVEDAVNAEAVSDYLSVLEYRVSESVLNKVRRVLSKAVRGNRYAREVFNRCLPSKVKATVRETCLPNEEALNNYFIKYIHSHESINEFAVKHGGIPLLHPALGCEPDIEETIARRFAGKKIVPFHLRLRRLDAGYGGEHSYARDSDFLEWYDFLREAGDKYPDVAFVALGRLQEKPIELLSLPNVHSLRIYGMGLGHELTLMLNSDLFIGTSSGFAALANFSSIPYFITRMNPGSCQAYAIPEGAERLPFAKEDQTLIYAQETSELLMGLLEAGLNLSGAQGQLCESEAEAPVTDMIDIPSWLNGRSRRSNLAATTSRFFVDAKYCKEETSYLLLPSLERVRQALLNNAYEEAAIILRRLQKNFPDLCEKIPQYLSLRDIVSAGSNDSESLKAYLETLDAEASEFIETACSSVAAGANGWHPGNWIVAGGITKTLPDEQQPAFMLKATEGNTYWHTEKFVSNQPDGKITVHFDAMNSEAPSKHRVWIFEDGKYRTVGEFVAKDRWRSFQISIFVKLGSILEFQIDQADDAQWLSVRGFQIIGGSPLPLKRSSPVSIKMEEWTGASVPCAEADESEHGCRQWPVAGKSGFIKSPCLPGPGEAGLLVNFEARVDKQAPSFTSIYLFEGDNYRVIGQFSFGSTWGGCTLLLQPEASAPLRIQVDYPESVESLLIRNFQAIPVDWDSAVFNEV